jgi:hypothetical protein
LIAPLKLNTAERNKMKKPAIDNPVREYKIRLNAERKAWHKVELLIGELNIDYSMRCQLYDALQGWGVSLSRLHLPVVYF